MSTLINTEELTERDDNGVGGLCFHTIEQDLLPVERRKIRTVVQETVSGQVQLPCPPVYLEITELFVLDMSPLPQEVNES